MRSIVFIPLLLSCAAARPVTTPALHFQWVLAPRVLTPDGRDIDDGGVDVSLRIDGRTRALGNFPGTCRRIGADDPPGSLDAVECTDPHVDVRFVVAVSRPAPNILVFEQVEQDINVQDVEEGGDAGDRLGPRRRRVLVAVAIPAQAAVAIQPMRQAR